MAMLPLLLPGVPPALPLGGAASGPEWGSGLALCGKVPHSVLRDTACLKRCWSRPKSSKRGGGDARATAAPPTLPLLPAPPGTLSRNDGAEDGIRAAAQAEPPTPNAAAAGEASASLSSEMTTKTPRAEAELLATEEEWG